MSNICTSMNEVAGKLLDAIHEGRPIIPIVGAGISADSGFPILTSIVRYFGKLRMAIEDRALLPGDPAIATYLCGEKDPLDAVYHGYQRENWRFIEDFGWPDRYQLTEDLDVTRAAKQASGNPTARSLAESIRLGLDLLLAANQPVAHAEFVRLKQRLIANEDNIFTSEAIKKIEKVFEKAPWDKNAEWQVFGDWRRMILGFTNYRGDLADGLLDRFARHRFPNLAHRYLAFLIRRLNVSVIFTMNFDPFIETALAEEGVRPRTFAMEHGLTLPHDMLVRDQLAVIKMHGSTHGLLLDEQLDRPLSADYLSRFTNIAGSRGADPFLLVIGCSGEDNRLLDLVRQAITPEAKNRTNVLWVYYEEEKPERVNRLNDPSIAFYHTNHIGGTLQHLYSTIDCLHPASRTPYLIHTQAPILLGLRPERDKGPHPERDETWIEKAWRDGKKLLLIDALTHVKDPDSECASPSATWSLIELGNAAARWGHNLIWVDLEAMHSLSAVAGTIIEQCRRYDPALAPCVLSVDDDEQVMIQAATKRVARALRRSRSFVAFSGFEAYTWSPTAHHGDTHSAWSPTSRKRLRNLGNFLRLLSEAECGESRLAVSVDFPRTRSGSTPRAKKLIRAHLNKLKAHAEVKQAVLPESERKTIAFEDCFPETLAGTLKTRLTYRIEDRWSDQPVPKILAGGAKAFEVEDKLQAPWALAFAVMATFRRTRPLPLVRRVLRIVLGEENVDAFLEFNLLTGTFRQVEGGGIIFYRDLRDHIYGYNTSKTSRTTMATILGNEPDYTDVAKATLQLLLNTCTHQMAAIAWHNEAYLESQDTFALLEYLYHRLASIRSLTKLIGLHEHADGHMHRARCSKMRRKMRAGVRMLRRLIFPEQRTDIAQEFEIEVDRFFKQDVFDLKGDWRKQLIERHAEELRRLEQVWRRSDVLLRIQVPAEQLVRWCDQFVDDDLHFFCDSMVLKYNNKGTPKDPEPIPCLKPGVDQNPDVGSLSAYIASFRRKVLIERSDYQRIFALDKPRSPELAGEYEEFAVLTDAKGMAKNPASLERAHRAIDRLSCRLRDTQQRFESIEDLCREIASLDLVSKLKWVKEANFLSLDFPHKTRGWHEIWLRGLHILSDCYFKRISVFSHIGFDGKPGPEALKEFSEPADLLSSLHAAIKRGSRLARAQTGAEPGGLHSPIVNAVPDGTLYLQYRSIFAIQHARFEWMQAVYKYSLDANLVDQAVSRALRGFEHARAGLTESNNLTLALADMHAAEACLAHGRLILHPDAPPLPGTTDDATHRFGLNRTRHEAARGYLNRAAEALLKTQRNVVWLRLYFRLAAQYQADRLFMGLVNASRSRPRSLGLYIQRLRRGYENVRNAEDLYLETSAPGDNSAGARRKSWLQRLRWELTLGAFALGLVKWSRFCCAKDAKTGEQRMTESDFFVSGVQRRAYLFKQIDHLLTTAGLQWDDPSYRDPEGSIWPKLFALVETSEVQRRERTKASDAALGELDDDGRHARKLRQDIINLAASLKLPNATKTS